MASLESEYTTMDNNTLLKPSSSPSSSLIKKAAAKNKKKTNRVNGNKSNNRVITDGDEEECGDVEAWDTLSKSFRQVQAVLDQNRELIQQANDNHQSKIPDNLAKNVGLINEINGNITKVISIYSDLSVKFSDIVHRRRSTKNGTGESTETEADEKFYE